jgi:hypothetical protein
MLTFKLLVSFRAENFNLKKTHYGGGCLEIMIAKEKNIL